MTDRISIYETTVRHAIADLDKSKAPDDRAASDHQLPEQRVPERL